MATKPVKFALVGIDGRLLFYQRRLGPQQQFRYALQLVAVGNCHFADYCFA